MGPGGGACMIPILGDGIFLSLTPFSALQLVGEKMQRSLEYYFNKPSSSAGAVPSESSEGTNTTKPVVLRSGPRVDLENHRPNRQPVS